VRCAARGLQDLGRICAAAPGAARRGHGRRRNSRRQDGANLPHPCTLSSLHFRLSCLLTALPLTPLHLVCMSGPRLRYNARTVFSSASNASRLSALAMGRRRCGAHSRNKRLHAYLFRKHSFFPLRAGRGTYRLYLCVMVAGSQGAVYENFTIISHSRLLFAIMRLSTGILLHRTCCVRTSSALRCGTLRGAISGGACISALFLGATLALPPPLHLTSRAAAPRLAASTCACRAG